MAERVKDRRRSPRVEASFGAKVTALDGGFEASVKNISMSGLLLQSDRKVPEMTVVHMRLVLPPTAKESRPSFAFEISGAVVRCQAVGRGNAKKYELAVFLTDMPIETRSALREFIAERLNS